MTADNTAYGLSAGVSTEKGSKAFALAKQLKAGVIWANTFNKFDPTSPPSEATKKAASAETVDYMGCAHMRSYKQRLEKR